MEIEEPHKLGCLFTPPQSFLRKSWVKRFCVLYNASSHGIQRLEIFDNDTAFLKPSKAPSKIIPLTDCVKVTPAPQKQQANVFEVRTKTYSYQFSADTFQEMTEWLASLQTVSFSPVFNSSLSVAPYVIQDIKQEENTLYSSMDEPEVYAVKSLNTVAMIRNKLLGDYKLIVTSVGISVAEEKSLNKLGKPILTWPYRHIRRYGCSKDNFSFEAGRKCSSGEGLFAFSSPDGNVIFQSVDAHVTSLKSSQIDGDTPLSPSSDDDKSPVFLFKDDAQQPNSSSASNIANVPLKRSTSSDQNSRDKPDNKESLVSKPAHPVSKPPRKSKAGVYVNIQHEESEIDSSKFSTFVDRNMNSANIYEDPMDNEFVDMHSRMDGETDRSSSAAYEPVYAVLEAEPMNSYSVTTLSDEIKNVCVNDDVNVKNNGGNLTGHRQSIREPDFYDHLSLQKVSNTRASRNNSDHVYGKLLPSRSSSGLKSFTGHKNTSVMSKHIAGQATGSNSVHCYTNVEVKELSKKNESADQEPKHFLRNDAEYAKVNKNKK